MEIDEEKTISTQEAAKLCSVSRGTINYWIQNKKLYAKRIGRNYSIPVKDLLQFLKSTGQQIPAELVDGNPQHTSFGTVQPCWKYSKESIHGQNCMDCIVFNNHLNICFISKNSNFNRCGESCNECQYYRETYLPRIQFIHQFDLAAAVYKDFVFWGGNKKFTELFEVQEKDLIGMGIERVVHPESIETMMNNAKKRAMGDPEVPRVYSIFVKNRQSGKIKIRFGVCPLNEPSGASFIFAESK